MSRNETRSWALGQIDNASPQVEEKRRASEPSQRRLRDIHVILNSSSPANQLPDELIIEIILIIKHDDPRFHTRWIKTTHVCHRWRTVALNASILWSTIDFNALHIRGELDTAQLSLQRSIPAAVDVRVALGCPNKALKSLAGQEHRVAHLHISNVQVENHELQTVAHLLRALTHLESLDVSALWTPHPLGRNGVLHLSTVQAARLRKLALTDGISVDVAGHLGNLTYLKLSAHTPDYTSWFSLIDSCPLLEFIWLQASYVGLSSSRQRLSDDEVMAGNSSHEGVPSHTVMRNLRTLKLELQLKPTASVLQRFSFPQTTRLSFDVGRDESIPSMAPALAMLKQMPTYNSLVLATQSLDIMLSGLYSRIAIWADPRPGSSCKALMRFAMSTGATNNNTNLAVIREILSMFSSSLLTFLCVGWTPLDLPLCLQILHQYPLLKELQIGGPQNIVTMLNALRPQAAPTADSTVPCLELDVLYLTVARGGGNTRLRQGVVAAALDTLLARDARGARLKELRLVDFDHRTLEASTELVERLKGLVGILRA
ncbi:uncharacterized protein C8Q71DRAFT_852916 [Rhodofomes roseus]|uniref:F-box domain-containing protein n=1 Tax=Rhodofomes roseus TaxID=34475 RepID=A0ABQ8KTE2_9APHY|nr:uncharacterized protein C8Q71DRAFT_852916 [Rhodofomes roseus]KAH9842347.1 hypothetical protein C8Q71DRAFT_852916 [Rhodofomes roseus]